jgi:hypothetical protein
MLHELGDDRFGLQIVVSVMVVGFLAHGAIEALDDAIGFRVPRFGLDIDQVVRLDDRRDVAIDELAAVIVPTRGLTSLAASSVVCSSIATDLPSKLGSSLGCTIERL